MADCFWDLGFDFAAVQKPNTLSFLENGFVANNQVSVPKNVKKGDRVFFHVFNLTSGATVGDGTNILWASLQIYECGAWSGIFKSLQGCANSRPIGRGFDKGAYCNLRRRASAMDPR